MLVNACQCLSMLVPAAHVAGHSIHRMWLLVAKGRWHLAIAVGRNRMLQSLLGQSLNHAQNILQLAVSLHTQWL